MIKVYQYLMILKIFGIQIKFICLGVSNIEELESLTNPEYFTKGLLKIYIWFEDIIPLTDTFFDNINQIRLKEINFEFSYWVTGSFDIIRILKNAPQNIQTKFEIWIFHRFLKTLLCTRSDKDCSVELRRSVVCRV